MHQLSSIFSFFQTVSANGLYPAEWRNIYDDVNTLLSNFGGLSGSLLASEIRESPEYALSTSGFSHLGSDHNFAGNFPGKLLSDIFLGIHTL